MTLILNGELNIQCAGELKAVLVRSQQSPHGLLLNLEDVTEADLTCLQLLCSAHRSSVTSDKRFALTGDIPGSFRQVVQAAGFAEKVCCRPDGAGDACLWTAVRDGV